LRYLSVMKLLLLCLTLLPLVVAVAPPVDNGCNQCDCNCQEADCEAEDCTPSVAGATLPDGATNAGCGCKCSGCPSCVQAQNPVFDTQCSANIVLVLDESGSIGGSVTLVRNAVVSFLSSFGTINQIGGQARLGLVEFAGSARLVDARCQAGDPQPCQAYPFGATTCRGRMCTLNQDWINAVTNYMLDQTTGGNKDNDERYATGGCTNWGAALRLADQTPWQWDNTPGAQRPDVVLFFTDGMPTVHDGQSNGACNKNCNQNRDRRGTVDMKVGPCYGSHVGVGCYWADSLKARGTKVFLVGVGGISNHVPNTQLVTGPTAWDQAVGSFGTSDYVINADFAALGAIFYNVAKGLCQCLQDQRGCEGPNCAAQSNFDARVQIQTTAGSSSFAGSSVFEGYLYYDFLAAPARFAIEYLDATSELERTDIINPCQVSRRISCGGTCFNTADVAFIPRFFQEDSDLNGGPNPGTGFEPTASCRTGAQVYNKILTPNQPQQIEYLWVNNGLICGARAVDGTLYEFFQDALKSQSGVNNRPQGKPQQLRLGSTAPFNFEALNGCSSPTCSAEVEIVFIIDSNAARTDYYLQQEYVKNIAASFDDANQRIRFGAFIGSGNGAGRIPATGLQTQLVVFGNQVLGYQPPTLPAGPVDFYQAATAAINTFWPQDWTPADPPRYLITTVASVDAHGAWTAQERNAFYQLRNDRGVLQSWATGIVTGSSQLGTLESLSNNEPPLQSNAYTHYTALGTADLLETQWVDQAARMCPRADLCGGTCQGQCVCGQCKCPTCSSPVDKCQSASCPSPTSGCVVTDKRSGIMSKGGCLPDLPANRLPCTIYACDAATGMCATTPNNCDGCNCPPPKPCEYNYIRSATLALRCVRPGPLCAAVICARMPVIRPLERAVSATMPLCAMTTMAARTTTASLPSWLAKQLPRAAIRTPLTSIALLPPTAP